jgi:hypothetical protein
MSIVVTTETISIICFILPASHSDNSVFAVLIIRNRHFLPFGRADLTGLGWVGIDFVVARVRLGWLAVVHYRPDLTNQTSWATSSPPPLC